MGPWCLVYGVRRSPGIQATFVCVGTAALAAAMATIIRRIGTGGRAVIDLVPTARAQSLMPAGPWSLFRPHYARNHRQRDERRMLGVMKDRLFRDDCFRRRFVRHAGVQVACIMREARR